jgi:hypothetical protein
VTLEQAAEKYEVPIPGCEISDVHYFYDEQIFSDGLYLTFVADGACVEQFLTTISAEEEEFGPLFGFREKGWGWEASADPAVQAAENEHIYYVNTATATVDIRTRGLGTMRVYLEANGCKGCAL